MKKIKNRPAALGNPKSIKHVYTNSSSSQRARILKHLETCFRISTMQARSQLGVLNPPARIIELRRKGYQIDTHWIIEKDCNGITHRVGLYVYKGRAL